MSDEYVPTMRSTFLYFAYGSNLWTKRIHLQNPSAIRKGIAELKVSFQLANEVNMNIYHEIGSMECTVDKAFIFERFIRTPLHETVDFKCGVFVFY